MSSKIKKNNYRKINQENQIHNDSQVINQLVDSVEKSEKAIQDTLKSIDMTMKYIETIDKKVTRFSK